MYTDPTTDQNGMPQDLQDHITELDQWAEANRRDARRDTVAFWILKVPAIVASAGSGVWAYYNLTAVSLISGAIASACIIIDGVLPRGTLRNIHTRAFHDIRSLMAKNVNEWRTRTPTAKPDNVARKILQGAQAERDRIAKYIRDAEAALLVEMHE